MFLDAVLNYNANKNHLKKFIFFPQSNDEVTKITFKKLTNMPIFYPGAMWNDSVLRFQNKWNYREIISILGRKLWPYS